MASMGRLVVLVLLVAGCQSTERITPSPAIDCSQLVAVASEPGSSSPLPGLAMTRDPDLVFRLPFAWQTESLASLRAATDQLSLTTSGVSKAGYDRTLAEIDAGIVRLYAAGPAALDQWEGTLIVKVTNGESAEAEIDTLEADNEKFATVKSKQRSNVTLAIGQAVRLSVAVDPPGFAGPGAVPARGVAYAVELEDGRILVFNASGPEASPTFEKMIDDAVATLSPSCST